MTDPSKWWKELETIASNLNLFFQWFGSFVSQHVSQFSVVNNSCGINMLRHKANMEDGCRVQYSLIESDIDINV